MARLSLRSFLAVGVVLYILCGRAWGIVVASGAADDTPPVNDPGFNNVGHLNGASGVYLGNRWVLTAGHVGPGAITLQGTTYQVDTSTPPVYLQNPPPFSSLGPQADAVMFRLQTDPGLPALQIAATQPVPGQQLLMVGNGLVGDGSGIHYYHHDLASNAYYEQSPPHWPGPNDFAGMSMAGTATTRWGENLLAETRSDWSGGTGYFSLDFCTYFDHSPYYYFPLGSSQLQQDLPNEAQAATGDSGGAAFIDGKLAGIIFGGTAPTAAPVIGNTAFFSDASYMVRLASYRNQILELTQTEPVPISGDFNQDGVVNGADITAMLRALSDLQTYKTTEQLTNADLLAIGDFDHSGSVDGRDIQLMLDFVASLAGGSVTPVPEPATWLLAFVGIAALLWRRLRRPKVTI